MIKSARHDKEHAASQATARGDAAAQLWWDQWASDHKEQIAAYNDEVLENGVWSDELRLF